MRTRQRRVLLADANLPTRVQIGSAIRDAGFVVAEVEDAPAAVQAAVTARPDVCLLDVRMPGSGIRAAWEIHARLPKRPLVLLADRVDARDLLGALRAGAVGYVAKDIDPRRWTQVVDAVLRGEYIIPRALVSDVVEAVRDRNAHRRSLADDDAHGHLTSREWEVLELLCQSHSTADIADRLVVSPVTIRTHVTAIVRKLGFRNREELLREYGRGEER